MNDGTTPLILAARLAVEGMVAELINCQADVNAVDDHGRERTRLSLQSVSLHKRVATHPRGLSDLKLERPYSFPSFARTPFLQCAGLRELQR